jgi:uncharacterized protein YcbX
VEGAVSAVWHAAGMTARVTRLSIAPVKGLALVDVDRVQIGRDGVAEDRRLYLLDERGAVVTLRRHPRLSTVVPELDLSAGTLALTFPGGERVTGSLDELGSGVSARLYGRDRPGRVVLGPFADALAAYAGEPLSLVLLDREGLGWDEGPVSLISRASMLAESPPDGERTASRRYRMLIEVDGVDAYVEDGWVGQRVRVGDVVLHEVTPLGRCTVPDHDPDSGEKDWVAVRALLDARGTSTLGVFCEVAEPGTVRVGDAVEVIAAAEAAVRDREPALADQEPALADQEPAVGG